MKKIVSFLLIILIALSSVSVCAAVPVSVFLNGVKLEFDVPPQIIDGRTMVPMRKIFEALGAIVTWDDASRTATGKKGDTVVNVTIDSKALFKNGVPVALDVPPMLIDSRTLVPVRAIAESFDCEVSWIDETRTVNITADGEINANRTPLTASEISEKVSPSVFYIEVYDRSHKATGSGSGFFISSDGVAVTNYHVIEGSSSARITTIVGDVFDVSGVVAFDKALDIAIIRINKTSVTGKTVSGFSTATLADSDKIKAGQNVFALGSPMGLQNTISNGIISNVKQVIGEDTFIQITAPISHGSSGGALVNEFGEVLGITSAGIDDAQNIGFAIPINVIKMFDLSSVGNEFNSFSDGSSAFILDVSTQTIEMNVGESREILVYAEGKTDNDWSIYWDVDDESLVECSWGDWLEENDSVCPLTIFAKNPGTAIVTIYSDVDFKGKDITVHVKGSKIPTYPSNYIKVPTYTAITGVKLHETRHYESNDVYIYQYSDIDVVQSYVDYLLANGFTFYSQDNSSTNSTSYYYLSPDLKLFSLVVAHRWKEIWLYIGK